MPKQVSFLPNLCSVIIFASRWIQVPIYVGLIIAQVIYVLEFLCELLSLLRHFRTTDEVHIMLVVLNLIDIAMISNLLVMVIIGGYETFVSKLSANGHPDLPKWLHHINTNTLKTKVLTALVCISSIHLLKTFIDIHNLPNREIMWKCLIHTLFLVSAYAFSKLASVSEEESTKTPEVKEIKSEEKEIAFIQQGNGIHLLRP